MLAVAALVLAVVVPALPAAAAPDGRIVGVQPTDGKINVVFQARNLPQGEELDPRRVTLSVAGQQLRATAQPLAEATTIKQVTLLTLDVSRSMQRNNKLQSAKTAADNFLRLAPSNVLVGVVAFSDTPWLLVKPTTDRNTARKAIRSLTVDNATELYDAVELSVQSLGREGVRSIVLLSDGKDEGSESELSKVVQMVRGSGVVLDAVAIDAADALPALQQLAKAGRGRVVETNRVADLITLFQNQARDLNRRLVVSAALPAGTPSGSASVTVTVQTSSRTLTAQAEIWLPGAARPPTASARGPLPAPIAGGLLHHPLLAVFAFLLIFAGLATILGVGLTALAGSMVGRGVGRRLSLYTLIGRPSTQQATTALGQHALARSAVHMVDRIVAKRGIESGLRRRLEAGGINLTPAEWIIVHGGITLLLLAFLFLLTGGSLLRSSIGLLLGFLGPYVYLTTRDGRRKRRFLEQLPDTLQLLAGSLEAGHSLAQAVDAVAREAQDPVSTEFNRAIMEARLGVPVDDTLDSVAQRMQCRDFTWVVMAIRIQREVGGNLAEILKTVSSTLRERERLRRQLRVVSAEGRLSGWILGGLPLVFTAYLILVRPDYISALVTTIPGILLTILATLLMIIGILWMRRIVDVEV